MYPILYPRFFLRNQSSRKAYHTGGENGRLAARRDSAHTFLRRFAAARVGQMWWHGGAMEGGAEGPGLCTVSGTRGRRTEWTPSATIATPMALRHGRTPLGRASPLAHT